MSVRNHIIWNEGLFIKPQHFQQMLRYHEYSLNQRSRRIRFNGYGFSEVAINPDELTFGKIGLIRASGVMPDGSVFDLPSEARLPDVLEIPDGTANQVVYLTVPRDKENLVNITSDFRDESGAKYLAAEIEVKDTSDPKGEFTNIQVGQLRTRLMMESEDRSSFSQLALCRVMEKHTDGSLRLDDKFIPTVCYGTASPVVERYLSEMNNILAKRSDIIARRIGSPGQGGVAEVTDFLMLQVMNRYRAEAKHYSGAVNSHLEQIYLLFLDMVSELSTFDHERTFPDNLLAYDHDHPSACINQLVDKIKGYLNVDRPAMADSLPIIAGRYGLYNIPVNDATVFHSADFILAIKADLPQDKLQKEVQQKLKMSSIENIDQLVRLAMPGIPLIQLPVAPRQLPFHAGYSYFRVDVNDSSYKAIHGSTGFSLHISGEISGLEMEFWVIRG